MGHHQARKNPGPRGNQEGKDYTCIGWHTTDFLRPIAVPRIYRYMKHLLGGVSLGCDEKVPPDETGYCELVHTETGETKRVLQQSYHYRKELRPGQGEPRLRFFECSIVYEFMEYKNEANLFKPDPPLQFGGSATASSNAEVTEDPKRGIVMQVYAGTLATTYALIRVLRDYNCRLPIELWLNGGEDEPVHPIMNHPVLKKILRDQAIALRFHWDYQFRHDRNKIYSVAYSSFDEVLFLDNDNFPLRDPTYLFDAPEYQSTGALFWKDLWSPSHPDNESLIRERSVLCELLDIPRNSPIVRETEMDAGQLVINRKKSQKALTRLLFYAGTYGLWFQPLNLLSGKDLFRFAWHLADESPFHYISQRPGIVGFSSPSHPLCGNTLVQHDPAGEPLFFHRAGAKIITEDDLIPVWEQGQFFKGSNEENYEIDEVYAQGKRCFFPKVELQQHFDRRSFQGTDLQKLEKSIIEYAREALNSGKAMVDPK